MEASQSELGQLKTRNFATFEHAILLLKTNKEEGEEFVSVFSYPCSCTLSTLQAKRPRNFKI
jgi:hypothetical protein